MWVVPYQIELITPCIFPMLEGEPNSAITFDYIPGSVMRGVTIGALMRATKRKSLELSDPQTNELFFSDEVLYLNATLVLADEQGQQLRSQPVPMSWRKLKYPQNKHEKTQVWDVSVKQDNDEVGQQTSAKKKKSMTSDYAALVGPSVYVAQPERVINVHTQRYRHDGIQQLVYRYDGLAANQVFEGEIRCTTEAQAQKVFELLGEFSTSHIGGARTAGYGQVRIAVAEPALWNFPSLTIDGLNVMNFVSHTILLNEQGNYEPTPATLEAYLQHRLAESSITIADEDASFDTVMIGGFNRKWGLPTPQAHALRMRSVVKLALPTDEQVLNNLLFYGIGERRNEGYGQVLINWQTVDTFNYHADVQYIPSKHAVDDSRDGKMMIELLEARMAKSTLERTLTRLMYHHKTKDDYAISGSISRTQLGRLRRIIKNELREKSPKRTAIVDFFEAIKGKYAERQYKEARIGGYPLTSWIKGQAADQGLDDEVLLRFVDAVLERKQKEIQKEQKAKRNGKS